VINPNGVNIHSVSLSLHQKVEQRQKEIKDFGNSCNGSTAPRSWFSLSDQIVHMFVSRCIVSKTHSFKTEAVASEERETLPMRLIRPAPISVRPAPIPSCPPSAGIQELLAVAPHIFP
jgi:hypothetical protein